MAIASPQETEAGGRGGYEGHGGYGSYVYKSVGGVDLKAHVFSPDNDDAEAKRSAIVMFHGGGWNVGSPEWTFSPCRYFAARGMVAVAAQYRLADEQAITPLEAMSDARSVFRWLRRNADKLGIDPNRIAGAGWSAGGHLVASAAIFDDPAGKDRVEAAPNAMVLWYPAVAVARDRWFAKLLGDRAEARDASPAEHVRPDVPATIIFQGSTDRLTPLAGVQLFCKRMKQAGNRCDLHVYEGQGHLFSHYDPQARRDAMLKADRFLVSEGFLQGQPNEVMLRGGEGER
jgi:acetyl esterase/lipase